MKILKASILILVLILSFGFISKTFQKDDIVPYVLDIPEGFPEPAIPENNELTSERIELGRMLFYDPVLSVDSSISCASCHKQELGFADDKSISPGVEGRLAMRNAPTLANVVYNPTFLFDGFLETLEMQVLVPIEEHPEFAYNREIDPFVITRSISSFERTLISGNSKYDQQVFQKKNVLNKSEKRGMNLFMHELECASCHSGFNFTNFSTQNNGLYEIYADSGRQRVTKLAEDKDMFKVPTLRNIELTAPYMHDGSFSTLEEVIDHYQSGGKNHPNKSEKLKAFELSKREKKDLINFLKSLTDDSFITNPDFSNPFK
jgi:cytochrome c peroxidase